jgi:hypothetical protein
MLLYKYRSPINFLDTTSCNTARIFKDSQLYFASLSTFNDPFEGLIELDTTASKEEAIDRHWRVLRTRYRSQNIHILKTVIKSWHDAAFNVDRYYEKIIAGDINFFEYYKTLMNEYGVLSLSEMPDNLLLWAHYANNHCGLCLGFEWSETDLPRADEVVYQTNYRKIDCWLHTEDELAQIALLQKSSDWSYEREYRSICEPTYNVSSNYEPDENCLAELKAAQEKNLDEYFIKEIKNKYTFSYRQVEKTGYGAKHFPKESLKEVIFGLRMTKEERNQYICWINSLGYYPKFKFAERAPERYKLQLKIC